jgi:hypothetical protein
VKRIVLAAVLILTSWTLVDALVHRFFLEALYATSPTLWRPSSEINAWLVTIVSIGLVAVFVVAYSWLVRPKTLLNGLFFGSILGIGFGVASGFGTYIHSPIPLSLAWAWVVLGTCKGVIAGAILGFLER